MDAIIRKVIGAIGGVLICIAIWTIQGKLTGGDNDIMESIPRQVWGGGSPVTLEVEASEEAYVSASFETNNISMGDPGHEFLESWQKVPAGKHTFDIDVPANVSGSVWVRVDKPNLGAKVHLALRSNGKLVGEDEMTLDKPLEPGYGFSAGLDVDDYAKGKLTDEGFFD
jgi:hypothetical protein